MLTSPLPRRAAKLALVAMTVLGLSACNTLQRLSEVGSAPSMTEVENPTLRKDYRPVSMPMPAPVIAEPNPNSLWRPGARAFFKDQRAGDVGDILTVLVNIQSEQASFSNTLARSRSNDENAGLPSFLGYESKLSSFLPDEVDPANLIGFGSDSDHTGTGSIARQETVNMRLAAVVLQILPNGNLVIGGRQEVRVNGELRELTVTGVIRPEDISSANTISWSQIAEARISYGGRGTVSDMVEPRYGQQIYDIVFPF